MTGGFGAVAGVRYDSTAESQATVFATMQLQADGTQTLTVYKYTDASTYVPIVSLPGLSSGFADLRLVIDPDQEIVNVRVNGEDMGTYQNSTYSTTTSERHAVIQDYDAGAEFDYICVRASEGN